MADRRCPYCGERVPNTSVTCPKCFKKIPVEPQPAPREEKRSEGGGRVPNRTVAMLLTLIPGLFGFLGLGLIYTYPHRKRGYIALIVGFLVFVAAVMLTLGVFSIFIAVPMWIIYVLMYLGCLFMVAVGNISIRTF